jgi:hypothetical protein
VNFCPTLSRIKFVIFFNLSQIGPLGKVKSQHNLEMQAALPGPSILFNVLFPSIAYDFFYVGENENPLRNKQPGGKTHKTFQFFSSLVLSKLDGLFEKFFISFFSLHL